MALFGRRDVTSAAEVPLADPGYPFLSQRDGDRIRGLVARAFADRGVDMTLQPHAAVDAWGREFGLGPVVSACLADERGPGAWPGIVRGQVDAVAPVPVDDPSAPESARGAGSPPATDSLGAPDTSDALDALDPETLRAAVQLRLVHVHDVPAGAVRTREVGPGLVEVLALELPDLSRVVGAAELPRLRGLVAVADVLQPGEPGEPAEPAEPTEPTASDEAILEALRALALDHLRAHVPAWHALDRDGGHLDVLTSELPVVAALVLVLPEVVEQRLGRPIDPELGAFVAVPFARQLDVHVLHDATARASLAQLALFAMTGFHDGRGQISPDVYWWRPGRLERITHLTERGVAIDDSPELSAVLERLGPAGPALPAH